MFDFIAENWVKVVVAYAIAYAIAYYVFVRFTPGGQAWARKHEPRRIAKIRMDAEDCIRYRVWEFFIVERILDPFFIWANILRPPMNQQSSVSGPLEDQIKVTEVHRIIAVGDRDVIPDAVVTVSEVSIEDLRK